MLCFCMPGIWWKTNMSNSNLIKATIYGNTHNQTFMLICINMNLIWMANSWKGCMFDSFVSLSLCRSGWGRHWKLCILDVLGSDDKLDNVLSCVRVQKMTLFKYSMRLYKNCGEMRGEIPAKLHVKSFRHFFYTYEKIL